MARYLSGDYRLIEGRPLGNEEIEYGEYVISITSETPGRVYYEFSRQEGVKQEAYATDASFAYNTSEDMEEEWASDFQAKDIATGVIVTIVLYEVVKWGAAVGAAAFTGGGSLAAAAVIP